MKPKIEIKKQVSYCGVTCGTCGQGSGRAERTAAQLLKIIDEIEVKEWSKHVAGGQELDWRATEKTLAWMVEHTGCEGCLSGGGSPNCVIRDCAKKKGYETCSECSEIEKCTKYEFLGGDKPIQLKERLLHNRGKSKEQIITEAFNRGEL